MMDAPLLCTGFAPQALTAEVRGELADMFREFTTDNGFKSAEFVAVDCPLMRRDTVIGLAAFGTDDLIRTDAPVITSRAKDSNVSFVWADMTDLTDDEKAVAARLRDKYGSSGMSVRLAPKPYVSYLSVGADEPDEAWRERSVETLWKCQVFGRAVQKLLFRLHDVQEPKVWLSDLQTSCLSLIATGLSVKTTATVFSLSERRVLEHLDNAQKRLNAHSHSHAVAKAIALGLIAA